jgi:hypothetical protein
LFLIVIEHKDNLIAVTNNFVERGDVGAPFFKAFPQQFKFATYAFSTITRARDVLDIIHDPNKPWHAYPMIFKSEDFLLWGYLFQLKPQGESDLMWVVLTG